MGVLPDTAAHRIRAMTESEWRADLAAILTGRQWAILSAIVTERYSYAIAVVARDAIVMAVTLRLGSFPTFESRRKEILTQLTRKANQRRGQYNGGRN
jgi:hypothetical protein